MDVLNKAVLILIFCLLSTTTYVHCLSIAKSVGHCKNNEREALLKFKHDLRISSNLLSSWSEDENCCSWVGVVCDNTTGHVLALHLRIDESSGVPSSTFDGRISPFLSDLKHLRYLDLQVNTLQGMIPPQIGNLSNLSHLRLNGLALYSNSLRWLSGLTFLEYLDLSQVNLTEASDWLHSINMLPSLAELRLSNCELVVSPTLPHLNFTSLAILDLSDNRVNTSFVPSWMFSLTKLVSLQIGRNNFEGPIPVGFQNFTSLHELDISSNNFNSSIPEWVYSFNHLEYLNFNFNSFEGTLSNAITNLTSLSYLDLSGNHLEVDTVVLSSLGKLCKLREIDLSYNNVKQALSKVLQSLSGCLCNQLESLTLISAQLWGGISNQLGQFEALVHLKLWNNSISGPIPKSIRELRSLKDLDFRDNMLNGTLPLELGELSELNALFLDRNLMNGTIYEDHFSNLTKLQWFTVSKNSLLFDLKSNWIPPFQLEALQVRSCHIMGQRFPRWLHTQKRLIYVDLSDTGISDTIPSWFWNISLQYEYLNLSHNAIYGEISNVPSSASVDLSSNILYGPLPQISSDVRELFLSNNSFNGSTFHFLCQQFDKAMNLSVLNLEKNFLIGEIPDCWERWSNLYVIKLSDNSFTGAIPSSLGTLVDLRVLDLHNNKLFGRLPLSLKNCSRLIKLDVSGNYIEDVFPTWIGESLQYLKILRLHSNKFHGHIPHELCALSDLHILDISNNKLSGPIPRCLSNLISIVNPSKYDFQFLGISFGGFRDNEIVLWKGEVREYNTILVLVKILDLSRNSLSGEIPKDIVKLHDLQTLNLSNNLLSGKIPQRIGEMNSLETLDLSLNQLLGEIPPSISELNFLKFFNVSNNKLSGRIPLSTQLQSFDASSFMGNKLCGPPLTKNCSSFTPIVQNNVNGHGEVDWCFYVSVIVGFVIGFWGVLAPLILTPSWRFAYYKLVSDISSRFCHGFLNH